MLKNLIALILCAVLFSSCASLPSASGRDLASWIGNHSFSTKKAVILGDGVSPETAASVTSQSGAMVLYCPSRAAVPGPALKPGLTQFMKDVMASLRAMAKSNDEWEVAVAERARGQLTAVLAAMRPKELAAFRGKLVLSEMSRTDDSLQAQIKRVFGDGVAVGYVSPGAP